MTKNRTPTPVYLDPGMHPGLEVKGLMIANNRFSNIFSSFFIATSANNIHALINENIQNVHIYTKYYNLTAHAQWM